MGRLAKDARARFAAVKRHASLTSSPHASSKVKEAQAKQQKREAAKTKTPDGEEIKHFEQASSTLYFQYNTQLGPPYYILLDTNFINFSISNKLDVVAAMMDCLYAKCIPCITDCVMAELEKLGPKFRVALRVAKDPRFHRIPCSHKGTYADDCLVNRVSQHKCYIVATCDKDLKRRIRKIPGVPIMFITQRKYSIERMPDAFGAPK
jgi:U3 small nucleolar RNA-associated protein 24